MNVASQDLTYDTPLYNFVIRPHFLFLAISVSASFQRFSTRFFFGFSVTISKLSTMLQRFVDNVLAVIKEYDLHLSLSLLSNLIILFFPFVPLSLVLGWNNSIFRLPYHFDNRDVSRCSYEFNFGFDREL